MPTLYRRCDGGYFIRGVVSGSFCTWQVRDEALEILQKYGIGCTGHNDIPRWLFQELLEKGLVYTGGSGLRPTLVPWDRSTADSHLKSLRLALAEEAEGWSLLLLFPELPRDFLQQIDPREVEALLTRCRFLINGNCGIHAARLWPGKGGAACSVLPSESGYKVEAVGEWPASWDLSTWTTGAEGLNPTGTLFAGPNSGGLRLRPNEPLIPDTSYYLVVAIEIEGRRITPLLPPDGVWRRKVGKLYGWQAWEIQLPITADNSIREWCHCLGHPLQEPPWRLSLVSPPPYQYLVTSLPMITTGQDAIIAVSSPTGASGPDEVAEITVVRDGALVGHVRCEPGSQQYLAVPVNIPGIYHFAALRGRVAPLTFVATVPQPNASDPDLTDQPPALVFTVRSGDYYTIRHALRDGPGPHELRIPCTEHGIPEIEVSCPIPVDLSWSVGELRAKRSGIGPSEVAPCLEKGLFRSLTNGLRVILRVDAGAFGILHIQLVPSPAGPSLEQAPPDTRPIPVAVVSRARWLAVVVAARHVGQPEVTVPLPREIHTVLADFQWCRELSVLTHIGTVSATVLPHLYALVQTLQKFARHDGWNPISSQGGNSERG